jgi:hypothetical protein
MPKKIAREQDQSISDLADIVKGAAAAPPGSNGKNPSGLKRMLT